FMPPTPSNSTSNFVTSIGSTVIISSIDDASSSHDPTSPTSTPGSSVSSQSITIIVAIIVVMILVMILIGTVIYFVSKRKKLKSKAVNLDIDSNSK
uniref:Uncharacterized protein n=1 Tax=Amphimedon queenslandica TaxID=400682 RepID=A0A1X7T859_AMPQE